MNLGDVSWPEGGGRHNVRLQKVYHFTKISNRDLPTIDSSLMHSGTIILCGSESKLPIEPQQTWKSDMAATDGDTQNDDFLHPKLPQRHTSRRILHPVQRMYDADCG